MINSGMKKETSELLIIALKALFLLLIVQVSPWLVLPCSILLDIVTKKTNPTETHDHKMLEPENSNQELYPTAQTVEVVDNRQEQDSPVKPKKRRTKKTNGGKEQVSLAPVTPKKKTRRSK